MNPVRIAGNELRRLSSGTLPKLAMVALVLVPLLYASFYLYANFDPYSRLDKLPAAVFTSDAGSKDSAGAERNVGREVTDELVKSGTFQWHEVSPDEAAKGVRDDTYSFAIGIPRDFSAALLSSGNFQPQQATITLTTNDANNYLSGTIAKQVAEQVRKTIAEKVGSEAADKFLVGFSTIYGKTQEAATGASQLADGAGKLKSGQQQLADGASQLASGSSELASGLGSLKSATAQLPAQTQKLASGAGQVADGNQKVADAASLAATASGDIQAKLDGYRTQLAQDLRNAGLPETQVQEILSRLDTLRSPVDQANTKIQGANSQLAQLASGARQVSDGAHQLASATPQLTSGIAQASDGANKLRDGAAKLNDGEKSAVTGTNQLADGAVRLRDGLAAGLNQIPNPDDPTRAATANTIADPVAVHSSGVASAGTYGAGLAPFFISLATWIGAFVLFLLLRPLSTRALTAGASPFKVALGGWLPSALLGIAQVIVLFGAVTWLVGIDVAHPLGAIGFAILVSLTFTAVVHALNAFFGAVGKFLGLVLLVLQLVSAGGTFPWQTIPDALYPLHIVLPMGYAIDGFRHLLYSGASMKILGDIGVLLAYLVGSILVSTLAARKRRTWTVSALKPELAL
ncbi:YhgE/Pip domain-containing protein [Amycolatopsis regifaucium]|uniref:ABC transporter n=1 Tax=Amycolatopsis regifaucium TaxID=546365 RepID=A0A154MQW4_9PSEU|nr:YhgE/Pip domain-containing protein [Amycolatopsis regifaucium]KZB86655.1 ABC transporter [Amycolatopsis regifaucium]OKA03714.1 ABC transporter [Amycolatopsis regifaucium]SFJ20376.1 putative membrane protein [Amycolatopsis regifaucium]